MGKIIYGNELAKSIKTTLKAKLTKLKEANMRLPKLVVILVGNDVGSASYVKGKEKDCLEIGILNETLRYDDTISEEELLAKIDALNADDSVDGILVQLPLPSHINASNVLFRIDPNKDVDGFHPYNIGKMMIQEETFLPCTPKGIMRILESVGYKDLSGLKAVVIGRSNIVGKPISQLLLNAHATVTTVHSRTIGIEAICKEADIVIAACGKPKLVKKEWLKEDAVVIDVGVNRGEDNALCGDVDFVDCLDKVKWITPVPKGVGPMTRAMLMENTWQAYLKKEKRG